MCLSSVLEGMVEELILKIKKCSTLSTATCYQCTREKLFLLELHRYYATALSK